MIELKRKTDLTRDSWLHVHDHIDEYVTTPELEALIDRTVDHIRTTARGKFVAYGWSGGKDAITLQWLMEQAGVDAPPFIALTRELEYPAFTQWVRDNAPDGLEYVYAPLGWKWLRDHPNMVFPQTSRLASDWMFRVQRTAIETYSANNGCDLVAVGKRTQDGNWVGPRGSNISHKKGGASTWSPIADWRHVDVVALQRYAGLVYPPTVYDTPRGYEVGTGPWPARSGTSNDPTAPNYGWNEVWAIDPEIVRQAAAEGIPGASEYLERTSQ